jgi:hypothetical protein
MSTDQSTETLTEALKVVREIKEIEEGRLAQLKGLLDNYKEKIKRDLVQSGNKKSSCLLGEVKIVEKTTPSKLNELEIAKQLGVDDLSGFRIQGKPISYVQFNLVK